MTTQHLFTVSEAAIACGVSESKIRRSLPILRKYGADQNGKARNRWEIPASALIAAGLPLDKVEQVKSDDCLSSAQAENDALIAMMKGQIADLRAALERERVRADNAEARLDRLLPSAPADSSSEPPRRGWWARLFG